MTNHPLRALLTVVLPLAMLAVACSSGDKPNTGVERGAVTANASQADDEEEVNDKIFCKVDLDCDSDERCVSGKCAGLDGEKED